MIVVVFENQGVKMKETEFTNSSQWCWEDKQARGTSTWRAGRFQMTIKSQKPSDAENMKQRVRN